MSEVIPEDGNSNTTLTTNATIVGNIHVTIRFRPLNDREVASGSNNVWAINDNSVQLAPTYPYRNSSSCQFSFDSVYGSEAIDNGIIYDNVVRNITDGALKGINGTIFAYGQTSAGKTFTMFGTDENPGIISIGVAHVFELARNNPEREYSIRVSYLEIYNETIRDLLCPENDNLRIHESLTRGIFVGNLTEEPVSVEEDALSFIKRGEVIRHVGETNMNERSSRSHTLFRLAIESREKVCDRDSISRPILAAALTFVDLAGSEKVRLTGAEGMRLKEGGHINKSLLALTTVISKLAEGGDRTHIPYRDSKLTRILQTSLGGNANTAVICAVTPASDFVEETLSTLKFASRAKIVTNKPRINEFISDQELLRRAQEELALLKQQIDENGEFVGPKRRKIETCDGVCQTEPDDSSSLLITESIRSLPTRIRADVDQLWRDSLIINENNTTSLDTLRSSTLQMTLQWQKQVHFALARYVTAQAALQEASSVDFNIRLNVLSRERDELYHQLEVEKSHDDLISEQSIELEKLRHSLEMEQRRRNICTECQAMAQQLQNLETFAKEVDLKLELLIRNSHTQEDYKSRVEELTEIVKCREEEVSLLLDKMKTLQADYLQKQQNLESETETLHKEVELHQDTIRDLRSEIDTVQLALKAMELENKEKQEELENTIAGLVDRDAKQTIFIKELEGELEEYKNFKGNLKAHLKGSEYEAEGKDKGKDILEYALAQLKSSEERILSLRSENTFLVEKLSTIESQLKANPAAEVILRIELEKLRALSMKEKRKLELTIADLKDQILELNANCK